IRLPKQPMRILRRNCRFAGRSGHHDRTDQCPLSRDKADIGRTSRLNAVFTMLAILIYWRLTEVEQTKNYLSLSRGWRGGRQWTRTNEVLGCKSSMRSARTKSCSRDDSLRRQRDCELPAVIRGQVRHVRRR